MSQKRQKKERRRKAAAKRRKVYDHRKAARVRLDMLVEIQRAVDRSADRLAVAASSLWSDGTVVGYIKDLGAAPRPISSLPDELVLQISKLSSGMWEPHQPLHPLEWLATTAN